MHIVHLYDGHEQVYNGRGSVPNVVWNVARGTAQAGHDVTVLERQWDDLPTNAEHDGVTFDRLSLHTGANEPWSRVPYEEVISPLGFSRLVADRTNFAVSALRRLRHMEFDVLHVHLPFAANVLVTVAPWLRKQTVFTAHLGELRLNMLTDDTSDEAGEKLVAQGTAVTDGGETEEPSVPGILTRFSPDIYLAKRAAQTTVLNPAIEEAFIDRDVSNDSLRVIPNGVDIDRFGSVDQTRLRTVREKYDLGSGPTVLFVGTIMPRKGVTELVHALGDVVEIVETEPNVVIAGERDLDEEYANLVERRVEESGLTSQVTMPGFVPADELPALYTLADIFVVPSLEEGFGMTAIEAMAAGTPVVATRVGGLSRVIESGIHGRLVDPGDVDGLAVSLSSLLQSPELCAEMRERACERAQEYSWEAVGSEFVSVYQEVAA